MNSYECFSVQLEVLSRSTLTHFAHFPDRFNFRFWCYSRMLIRLRSHLFTLFIHLKTHPKWKSTIPDIIFVKSRKVQKLPEPAVL